MKKKNFNKFLRTGLFCLLFITIVMIVYISIYLITKETLNKNSIVNNFAQEEACSFKRNDAAYENDSISENFHYDSCISENNALENKSNSLFMDKLNGNSIFSFPQYKGTSDDYSQPINSNRQTNWTNHSADDAIAWCYSQNGKYLDHDGAYGAQCVDLTMYYYDYLGPGAVGGNACDYTWNYLPDGWQRFQGAHPQKGDILIYLNDSYGHVAIYENDNSIFHQNYCGHQYVEHSTFRYDDSSWIGSNYWGCIHPDFKTEGGSDISIENGVYTIKSCVGDKYLDIAQNSYQTGANAHIWHSIDYDAQHFNIYYNKLAGDHSQGGYHIEHGHSGLFLDTEGNSSVCGTNVFQWGDSGSNGQYWRFEDAGDGYVYIRSLLGMYLDVDGGKCQDGQNVQSWIGNKSLAQKWRLCKISEAPRIDISSGLYNLRSAVGDRNLDVYSNSFNKGANLDIYSVNDTDAQNFNIYWNPKGGDHSQGGYRIEHVHSGLFVDTYGNEMPPGTNIQQWTDSGSNGQYWIFEDAGNGCVYVHNLWGYYLDVYGGIDADENNVQTWNWNGSAAQKWKLIKRSDKKKVNIQDGDYYIHSNVGNKVLEIKDNSTESGANVQINNIFENPAQVLNLTYNNNGGNLSIGGYHIEHNHLNKYFDTKDNSRNPGANVFQWGDSGSNGQYWRFEDAGDGWVYIYNLWGNYLTVDNGLDIPGRNVSVDTFKGDCSQKFRFEPIIGYQQFMIPQGSQLPYNGQEQIGVSEGYGYIITDNVAKEVGKYVATAVLINPFTTVWIDGTTAPKKIEWEIY